MKPAILCRIVPKPRPEPVTAEDRVSYIDLHGNLVVFDIPTSCSLCVKCLGNVSGQCVFNRTSDRRMAAWNIFSDDKTPVK